MFLKKYLIEILICINIVFTLSLLGLKIYDLYYNNESLSAAIETESENFKVSVAEDEPSNNKINVEIKGAVQNPGVYSFTEENIINDLIACAGGFTANAFTNNINLSKKMQDQMVVYVYTKYEYSLLDQKPEKVTTDNDCKCQTLDLSSCLNTGSSVIETGAKENLPNSSDIEENSMVTTATSLININTADANELVTLNGIGEAKAKNIINYRIENGNFVTIEDIKKVSGISESIYEKIKDYITV